MGDRTRKLVTLPGSLQARVEVPQHVLVRDLGGESVFLNLETELYLGLDEPSTVIWDVLTTTPTVLVAFQKLLDVFDVEPDVLRADLERWIGELQAQGLIEIRETEADSKAANASRRDAGS
jgi:hypothetical protein